MASSTIASPMYSKNISYIPVYSKSIPYIPVTHSKNTIIIVSKTRHMVIMCFYVNKAKLMTIIFLPITVSNHDHHILTYHSKQN